MISKILSASLEYYIITDEVVVVLVVDENC